MKKKIYLAKSNRSNPDIVQKLRKQIKQEGFEVVEYTGGIFTHTPMLESDIILVVPDLSRYQYECDFDTIDVGKGLFTQIDVASRDEQPIYIIRNDRLEFTKLENNDEFGEITGYDDYINYGYIILDNTLKIDLIDILCLEFGETYRHSTKPNEITNYVSKKYLLIGK